MRTVRFTKIALKALRIMPQQHAELVRAKIDRYAAEPDALANNVRRLQGRPGFRLRVGDLPRHLYGGRHGSRRACDRPSPRGVPMTVPLIQATIDGDRVTMHRAEFERLVALLEEAEDGAAFDAVQRRLARGEEEVLPAAMVDRIIGGQSPVRAWRDHRGLTGKALAERAGISPAYLAQIEGRRRAPSLTVLTALARALAVTLDDLV